ncbi:MAG: preprotein translocase subunit SecE [Bacteroidia bacterium]|jgi:preprotein translocase subunit SecE|nr:preprotein translocase subunit SecE [Bacteroidia bacterium]
MSRITAYFRDIKDELVNKVSWPTWEELTESTIIVLVASIIFALIIWLMDTLFGYGLSWFYDLF